jgi:hypothetical protein
MRVRRPYGFKKCKRLVTLSRADNLVYAENMAHACDLLNPAIKEHDLVCDPEGGLAEFKIVRFYRRKQQ